MKEIVQIIADELEQQAEENHDWMSNHNLFETKYTSWESENPSVEDGIDYSIGYDGSIDLEKLIKKLEDSDILQVQQDETAAKLDSLIEQKKVVI
jgi:hypothetical protein